MIKKLLNSHYGRTLILILSFLACKDGRAHEDGTQYNWWDSMQFKTWDSALCSIQFNSITVSPCARLASRVSLSIGVFVLIIQVHPIINICIRFLTGSCTCPMLIRFTSKLFTKQKTTNNHSGNNKNTNTISLLFYAANKYSFITAYCQEFKHRYSFFSTRGVEHLLGLEEKVPAKGGKNKLLNHIRNPFIIKCIHPI